MKNKNVFYTIGWDDNGLPTERRVQNHYKVWCSDSLSSDSADTQNLSNTNDQKQPFSQNTAVSRKKFAQLCHELSEYEELQFRNLFTRLGLSVDWSNTYRTISHESRYLAQLSFLQLLKKNQIYQAVSPTFWDCEFGTAIAQAEIVEKEVSGIFYTINFSLQSEPSSSFQVATTRPELIAACIAIAVNPEDCKNAHLIGKTAITPVFHVPVPIIAHPLVDAKKGTGVLMLCTFGDSLDVEIWNSINFPLRCIISAKGKFKPLKFLPKEDALLEDEIFSVDCESANKNYSNLVGKRSNEGKKIMVDLLGSSVVRKVDVRQEVKFFERGSNPIQILPTKQWYARILDKREALLKRGYQVNWHPASMQRKYQDWVEGLRSDWCISRQRHFGVSLPIYYKVNSDGQVQYEEWILPSENDLPIDPVCDTPRGYEESNRNQPNGFVGETDVFDTWWISSLTPQINTGWQLKKDIDRKKMFPMTLRPQSHEIIRTWAFYTIFKSLVHEDQIPWQNIAISGWIIDKSGLKISKSKGNSELEPTQIMEKYGADALRYWCASIKLGVDATFDLPKIIVGKRLAVKLFNAAKLILGQQGVDLHLGKITEPLDIAMLLQLQELIVDCNRWFEEYRFSKVLRESEIFFWSRFTDNYLEMIKMRMRDDRHKAKQISAITTARVILNVYLRLWAPIMPYITQEIWSWEFSKSAACYTHIHTTAYPERHEIDSLLDYIPLPEREEKISQLNLVMQCMDVLRKAKFDSKLKYSEPIVNGVLHVNGFAQLQPYWEDMLSAIRAKSFKIIENDSMKSGQFIALIEN